MVEQEPKKDDKVNGDSSAPNKPEGDNNPNPEGDQLPLNQNSRFQEVIAKKNQAQQRAEQAEAELQKIRDEQAEKEKEEKERIVAEKEAVLTQSQELRKMSALKISAIKLGIKDTEDLKSLDLSEITITEDSEIEGINEFLEKLKDKKPHWFGDDKGGVQVPNDKPGGTQKPNPNPAPNPNATTFEKTMSKLKELREQKN